MNAETARLEAERAAAGALIVERTARDWQLEASEALRTGKPPPPMRHCPPVFEPYVAAQRAKALQDVLFMSDHFAIRAVRAAQRAQRNAKGDAHRYGPVRAPFALTFLDSKGGHWCSLGPARNWRDVLREAAARNPDHLWFEPTGWRSLGLNPQQRLAARTNYRGWVKRPARTRTGASVTRDTRGS
jgi:hypothetical protein